MAIHGNTDENSFRKLADKTLDDLTNLSGITQVEIVGIRKPEIGIEVSENALREHGMSFDDVARALKKKLSIFQEVSPEHPPGKPCFVQWVKPETAGNLMNWK